MKSKCLSGANHMSGICLALSIISKAHEYMPFICMTYAWHIHGIWQCWRFHVNNIYEKYMSIICQSYIWHMPGIRVWLYPRHIYARHIHGLWHGSEICQTYAMFNLYGFVVTIQITYLDRHSIISICQASAWYMQDICQIYQIHAWHIRGMYTR